MDRGDTDHPSAFAAELSRAVDRRGLGLSELRARLEDRGCPVSLTTLSYWRSGQRHPAGAASLAAVTALEELLHLAPGDLSTLVETPVQARPGPAGVPHEAVLAHAPAMLEVLRRLDTTDVYDPLLRSLHLVVDVDEDGVERRLQIRTLLRALVPDTAGFTYVFGLDEPLPGQVELEAVTGCRLDRTDSSRDGAAIGGRFEFERPLRAGETTFVEHNVHFGDPWVPQQHYEHTFRHRLGELMMQVRFHPDRVPDHCEGYFADRDGERRTRLDLTGRTMAHLAVRDQAAGTVGMTWDW